MQRKTKLTLIISVLIVLAAIILCFLRGSEDTWIADKTGKYLKHGNPTLIPEEVKQQQTAIECASELYANKNLEGMNFSSQCLGTCENYSIDIVHSPRTEEDNLPENQCQDYREGTTKHFMELNKNGEIVRIT